jgi:hypothetical protein
MGLRAPEPVQLSDYEMGGRTTATSSRRRTIGESRLRSVTVARGFRVIMLDYSDYGDVGEKVSVSKPTIASASLIVRTT